MSGHLPYDLTRLTRWSVPLIWASIAAGVALMGNTVVFVGFLNRAIAGEIDGGSLAAEAAAADQRTLVVALVYLAILVATYVANGMWIYRASWNARVLQPRSDRIAPGWAVGWYFVPILSLWKPFTAMRETWDASSVPGPTGVLGLWWAFWIISLVGGQISARIGMRAEAFEDIRAVSYIDLVLGPVSIIASLLFLRIVRRITVAQSAQGPAAIFA